MIPYPRQLANLAAADPDHPAITDEHRTVTRAELEALASDMAEEFAGLGVGPGDIVVLALPNCVEFLAAMIASWKVGATPTPVSSPVAEARARRDHRARRAGVDRRCRSRRTPGLDVPAARVAARPGGTRCG